MMHRWQKERQVSPGAALGAGCLQVPQIPGTGTPGKPQVGRHLEVSVHDAQAVQVGDSAKDLAHQVASVLLRVGATLHDSIEQLTPCHPEESSNSADPGPPWATAYHPNQAPPTPPRLTLPSSQLHGQIEVGRALMDIFQSHDVGVADPATAQRSPLWAATGKPSSFFTSSPPSPARQSPRTGLSWGHEGGGVGGG